MNMYNYRWEEVTFCWVNLQVTLTDVDIHCV